MASLTAGELFNVKGMVFVVTGGGSGIGAMIANALDANGASKVYILGRRRERLEEVASRATNGSIIPVQGDVTSKESLMLAADKVRSEVGFVNAVIANSGITGPTLQDLRAGASIDEIAEAMWRVPMEEYSQTFQLNVTAVLYTLTAFLPLLDQGNKSKNSPTAATVVKSQFICTSSIAAFNRQSTAGFGYGSSKAAVTHLMKMMANFLAPHQIRANVFAPGLYPSEIHHASHGPDWAESKVAEGSLPADQVPATRMGSAEDIAGTILYLCSRGGAYCNGNVVISDGGRLSLMPATY